MRRELRCHERNDFGAEYKEVSLDTLLHCTMCSTQGNREPKCYPRI